MAHQWTATDLKVIVGASRGKREVVGTEEGFVPSSYGVLLSQDPPSITLFPLDWTYRCLVFAAQPHTAVRTVVRTVVHTHQSCSEDINSESSVHFF